MDNIKEYLSVITLGIGATIGGIYGEDNRGIMIVLMSLILIDFITGLLYAYLMKELDSNKCFKGIFKKLDELILCGVCHLLDIYVLDGGSILLTSACFLFITAETLSLLENASRLGVPIPKKLVTSLIQIKNELTGGALNEEDIKTDIEREYEEQEQKDKQEEQENENKEIKDIDKDS